MVCARSAGREKERGETKRDVARAVGGCRWDLPSPPPALPLPARAEARLFIALFFERDAGLPPALSGGFVYKSQLCFLSLAQNKSPGQL